MLPILEKDCTAKLPNKLGDHDKNAGSSHEHLGLLLSTFTHNRCENSCNLQNSIYNERYLKRMYNSDTICLTKIKLAKRIIHRYMISLTLNAAIEMLKHLIVWPQGVTCWRLYFLHAIHDRSCFGICSLFSTHMFQGYFTGAMGMYDCDVQVKQRKYDYYTNAIDW